MVKEGLPYHGPSDGEWPGKSSQQRARLLSRMPLGHHAL